MKMFALLLYFTHYVFRQKNIWAGGGVTKADIVERIQNSTGVTKKDALEVVECFFEILKDTLESGETIKIAKFGNFEVKSKTARRGRNPQTGEEITLVARQVLTFKASSVLKQAVNGGVE
jgi:integration host factor subunit alpha